MAGMYCLNDLLNLTVRERAEELQLEPDKAPVIVVHGEPRALDLPPLTSDNVAELFRSFATAEQLEELRRCGDIHFNYTFQNSARFGVAASQEHQEIRLKLKQLSR
jgi:Tfp pilus assembly pilus retraction ATPase PilT